LSSYFPRSQLAKAERVSRKWILTFCVFHFANRAEAERETRQEISDYQDLRNKLRADGSVPHEQDVDLGHGRVICRAIVEDTSTVYVHVGMGFHVEMLASEAVEFVEKRIALLQSVLPHRTQSLRRVQDHVQSTKQILQELDRELQRFQ